MSKQPYWIVQDEQENMCIRKRNGLVEVITREPKIKSKTSQLGVTELIFRLSVRLDKLEEANQELLQRFAAVEYMPGGIEAWKALLEEKTEGYIMK